MGEWGGTSTEEMFWLDFDGDGMGSGDGYLLCNGLDLPGWVTNNDDSDDACYSNIHDCAGVCDGPFVVDACGVCNGGNVDDLGCGCFEPGPSGCDDTCGSTAVIDDCGVCDGGNFGDADGDGTCMLMIVHLMVKQL